MPFKVIQGQGDFEQRNSPYFAFFTEFDCFAGHLGEIPRMAVCWKETYHSMLAIIQQKIQNCRCSKNIPNLVSTVISTHTVILQYLFTVPTK